MPFTFYPSFKTDSAFTLERSRALPATPTVTVSDGLAGRVVTVSVDSLSAGATATLTASTGGTAVETVPGSEWTITVPSSFAAETVTWEVTATSSGGSATASGAETVPADLFAPAAAGGLADLSLTEDAAMAPVDVSADVTGTAPITFALAPASQALPAGLSLSAAGTLSGTPTESVTNRSIIVRGSNAGGHADTAFTIDVAAAVVLLTDPVTGAIWDVTAFDDAGTFEWGGLWAVKASGSVTFDRSDVTPAAGVGGITNGLMHNPNSAANWGFDSRISTYDAAHNITASVSVSAHDCLVLGLGDATPDDSEMQAYSVLHILTAAPPDHAICPPPFGYDGTVARPMHVIDCDAVAATLPAFDTTGHDQNDPATTIATQAQHFEPSYLATPLEPSRRAHGASDAGGADGYGRDKASRTARIMHHLICDQANTAEKADILGGLMTDAVMWHYGFTQMGDTYTTPDGGWSQGYVAPIKLMLALTSQSTTLSYDSNETVQPLIVDQTLLDRLQPHAQPGGWPEISRERTVSAVSGLDVTVSGDGLNFSGSDYQFVNTVLVRNNPGDDGSVTAVVTGQSVPGGNNAATLTLDTNPFSVSDKVYAKDRQGFLIGGEDEKGVTWGIRGLEERFSPSPSARYAQLQIWAPVLYLAAINGSYIDSQLVAALTHMRMAEKANTPSWDDYDSVAFWTLPGRFVGADFYSAHGETIIDAVLGNAAPSQMIAPVITSTGETSISVDRDDTTFAGSSTITSYDLRWSTDQTNWTLVTGISDPETVSGLTSETTYYVQTRALNAVGAGPWSIAASVQTDGASASAVTFVGSVTHKWSAAGVEQTLALPSGTQEGDYLVVATASDGGGWSSADTLSSWTRDQEGGVSGIHGGRFVGASDAGLRLTNDRANSAAAIMVFRGVANPVSLSAAKVEAGFVVATDAPPARTPTAAGQLYLCMGSMDDRDFNTGADTTGVPAELDGAAMIAADGSPSSGGSAGIGYAISTDASEIAPGVWEWANNEARFWTALVLDAA